MSKKVKLGILRLRHDSSQPKIDDAACHEMLTTGYHSVFGFWEDSSYGYLDLSDFTMFEWLTVPLTADHLTIPDPANNASAVVRRVIQAEIAIDALRARHPDGDPLAGLDGLVVITLPGTTFVMANPQAGQPDQPANLTVNFDAGAAAARGFATCALPVATTTHSFATHEVGHVLGLRHSFGLLNGGSNWNPLSTADDWLPTYGSPYDVMSAEQFGGGRPTYIEDSSPAASVPPRWPGARWASMGPALSTAMLYRAWPQALTGRAEIRNLPSNGQVGTARIHRAHSANGSVALILKPPGANGNDPKGSVVIEYRTPVGWDSGLDTDGDDAARAGVVVHAIIETNTDNGVQPWYQGNIVDDGLRSDLVVPGRALAISVKQFHHAIGGSSDYVDISYQTSSLPSLAIISIERRDQVVGGEVHRTSRTPCGDTVQFGHWLLSSIEEFGAQVAGLASTPMRTDDTSPIDITWLVAGQAVPAGVGQLTVTSNGMLVELQTFVDASTQHLQLQTPAGTAVSVVVTATARDHGGRTAASGPALFSADGTFDGINPEHIPVVVACIKRTIPSLPLPTVIVRPPRDPQYLREFWALQTVGALAGLRAMDLGRAARDAIDRVRDVISLTGQR
ncbi:hypothetical protein [Mycolicibacterium sp. XJ870]